MLPTPPSRDANGNVIPHDHPDIFDADDIIRRVSKEHIVEDPKVASGQRLSSKLFSPSSGNKGVSVDLKRPIEEDGLDVIAHVLSAQWIGAISLIAREFRAETLMVGYHPLPTNKYHGEVWGAFPNGRRKRLMRRAAWFIPLQGLSSPSGE